MEDAVKYGIQNHFLTESKAEGNNDIGVSKIDGEEKKSRSKKAKRKSPAQIRREQEEQIVSGISSIYQDYLNLCKGSFVVSPWEPFLQELRDKRRDKKAIPRLAIREGKLLVPNPTKSSATKGSKKVKVKKKQGSSGTKSKTSANLPAIPANASKTLQGDDIAAVLYSLVISATIVPPNPLILSLSSLILGGSTLSPKCISILLKFMEASPALGHLDLTRSNLHDFDPLAFENSIAQAKVLVSLTLDYNRLDSPVANALFQGLLRNLLDSAKRKRPFHTLQLKFCGIK